MRVRQGEWHIEGTREGWQLHLRPRLSLLVYAPSNLPAWSRFVFWPAALVSAAAPLFTTRPAADLAFAIALCAAYIWFMPHKWSFMMGTSYVSATRAVQVPFHHGGFDVPDGFFVTDTLRSLRLNPGHAIRGKVSLVFDGTVVPDVVFIGWPGLDESQANEVRQAIMGRLGQLPPVGGC